MKYILFIFCSFLVLSSCSSLLKPVAKDYQYNPSKAYIFGTFYKTGNNDLYIELLNIYNNKRYSIKFDYVSEEQLIEIDPGIYKIVSIGSPD